MRTNVPATVVAAQWKNGLLPDPFYGMNLRQYPGVAYPVGANFSNLPMPPDSPYGVSWWYRKEFTLPKDYAGKTVWLNFGGINYRANLWLNGQPIANSGQVAGAWRTYEFNTTSAVKAGTNVLAVQVWAPTEASLAINFVDWNPTPPDKNMGLWRGVYLAASGPVALRHPAVFSKVDSPANHAAHLTVAALVKNASDQRVKGTLKGKIENIDFAQEVELAAGEAKDIAFSPEQYPQLNVSHPRLWWPAQMGEPNLTIWISHSKSMAGSRIPRTPSSAFARSRPKSPSRRRTASSSCSRSTARTSCRFFVVMHSFCFFYMANLYNTALVWNIKSCLCSSNIYLRWNMLYRYSYPNNSHTT